MSQCDEELNRNKIRAKEELQTTAGLIMGTILEPKNSRQGLVSLWEQIWSQRTPNNGWFHHGHKIGAKEEH